MRAISESHDVLSVTLSGISRTSSHSHSLIRSTVALFASHQQPLSRYPSPRDTSEGVGGVRLSHPSAGCVLHDCHLVRRISQMPQSRSHTFGGYCRNRDRVSLWPVGKANLEVDGTSVALALQSLPVDRVRRRYVVPRTWCDLERRARRAWSCDCGCHISSRVFSSL